MEHAWLNLTNAAMGFAVFICFAAVCIVAIVASVKDRARRERIRIEIRKF